MDIHLGSAQLVSPHSGPLVRLTVHPTQETMQALLAASLPSWLPKQSELTQGEVWPFHGFVDPD